MNASASNFVHVTSDVFTKEFVLLDAVFSARDRIDAGTRVRVKATHFIPDKGLFYDIEPVGTLDGPRIKDVAARKVYEPAPMTPMRPSPIATGWAAA